MTRVRASSRPRAVSPVVRGVLFDLYGTLLDVEVDEASPLFWSNLANEARSLGVRLHPQQLRADFMGMVGRAATASGFGSAMEAAISSLLTRETGTAAPEAVDRFGQMFRALSIRRLQRKGYALSILEALRKRGCLLGLVSNTEAVLSRFDLREAGLDDAFDAVVLSSDVGIRKPNVRIFQQALKELRLDSVNCVFVGDNFEEDIRGALGAGMRAIHLVDPTMGLGADDAAAICAGFSEKEILAALEDLGLPRSR